MGNCFGFKSDAVTSAAVSGPPSKKQRLEQPYVTDKVEALRNQASSYHDKVVSCAKRSQDAWKKGDKGEAGTLSEEKKSWQKKKDDANRKAAKLILDPQKSRTTGEIDLHGLYLAEALDATKEFLKYWSKKSSVQETVLIITGAGHHSENNKAVIRPKVEKMIKDQSLKYESVHGNGAFRVALKPRQ